MLVGGAFILLLGIGLSVMLKMWLQVRGEAARMRREVMNAALRAGQDPPHGKSHWSHGALYRLPPRELLEGDYADHAYY